MKKLRIYIVLLGLSLLFILIACKKKKSCSELAADVSDAAMAYALNYTSLQACEDYVDAIHEYYDGCDAVPPAERESLDEWINSDPCAGL